MTRVLKTFALSLVLLGLAGGAVAACGGGSDGGDGHVHTEGDGHDHK